MKPARPSSRRLVALTLLAAAAGTGCAGATRPLRPGSELRAAPAPVTGENYTDVLRELDETAQTPALRPLRDASARYQARRGMERLHEGDTEGALRALHTALVYYSPEELGRGGLPTELAPLARGILQQVQPRGDEAHSLAANRVLAAVQPPDPEAMNRFRTIDQWGEQNRQEFRTPWTFQGEEADIYKAIARIIPAPDILRRATEFMIGRRRAATEARNTPPAPGRRLGMEDMQQLQAGLVNAAMDLAVLYLRLGDIQGAADQVAQLGGGRETGLANALRAIAAGEGGADGVAELASQLERVDTSAAAAICRRGRREYPHDPRFAQCLAILAARDEQMGLASAHMEAAARLAPDDQRALRTAIGASIEWFERELTNDDPTPGRRALARARTLLERWRERFPREAPPVSGSELEEFAARLELGQANLPAAQQHLERATQGQPPSREAYLTLAEIAWRHQEPRRAIELLQQGLALPLRPNESDSTFRPMFQLRLGLAARAAGDEALAQRSLTEAEQALAALTRSLEGNARAHAYFLHAAALDALGRTDEVRRDLDAAVNAAPENKDLAAALVTFCLGRGRWRDAFEIDRAARARLQLDRTWKTYFALWGATAARLARIEQDGGAMEALREIAENANEHSPWIERLAQRFVGAIDREQLMRYAGASAGHRAEALFYEAMLQLGAGDLAGAENDLRAVLQTEMLRYFEYDMAWEMLSRGLPALVEAARAAAAATPTAPAATPAPAPAPAPARTPSPRHPRR